MDRGVLKRVLGKIPYGVVVMGGSSGSSVHTMIATWITQVSFDPPMIAVALETGSTIRKQVGESGYFSLNLLPAGGMAIAKDFLRFSGEDGSTVNGHPFILAPNGTPYLTEALGSAECRVRSTFETGDHVLVVGEVVDAQLRGEAEALTLRETGWKYQR